MSNPGSSQRPSQFLLQRCDPGSVSADQDKTIPSTATYMYILVVYDQKLQLTSTDDA